MNISQLEMLIVLICFRLWAVEWKNRSICIFCDNVAVVAVLSNGKTKDSYLGACARSIWLLTAKFNINMTVKHIAGKENVKADMLSRWFHYKNVESSVVRHLKLCTWQDIEDQWLYPDFNI